MTEGNQSSAWYGISVASAGDVNADGHDDVIVGAYGYDNGQGDEGRAFVYQGDAAGLPTVAAWTAESNQAGAVFGRSVASAGDVNGDGYDDVIVGASQYDNPLYDGGAAFVYQGSPTGLATNPAWTGVSDRPSAYYGLSASSAGDVNGDGYDDVIVGAYFYDDIGESTQRGRAFVYQGSAEGLSTAPSWTVQGDKELEHFGYSVNTAGDVNGDGYDDVIVGAPELSGGQKNEGGGFVYLGSNSGLSTTPSWRVQGRQRGARFGYSVSTAGDVNGDGYDDVIVGAVQFHHGQSGEGRALVYLGSQTGLDLGPSWSVESNQAEAYLGYSVGDAGDVNGDGYDDVIVGARHYSNGAAREGRASISLGSPSGLMGNPLTVESDQQDGRMGNSVNSAGDVNGDGYDDVIVGAYTFVVDQYSEGAAFAFYGSALD